MKNLSALNQEKTMLSTEIVSIINSMREEGTVELRHTTFMAKVLKVLGENGAQNFLRTYLDVQNKERPCYALPRREANLMVMSENYKVQAAVYDRMVELEEKKPVIDPMQMLNDPAAMRGLLLTYSEKVIGLEANVKEMRPKVEALDRIATFAEGTYCIRDSAKLLQTEEKFLKAWLIEHEWTYRRPTGGSLLGYSDKLKKGYLEHKLTTGDKTDGSGGQWSSNQVRITSKGLAKLSQLLNIVFDQEDAA